MRNKYYTPIIEEFHVGFEYESLWGIENINGEWHKEVFKSVDVEQIVRVKYLDTDDIESLGFTKRGKTWAGYVDYEYTELIDGEVPYYLKATIHVPLMDDMYKIILHRFLNEDTNIDKQVEQGESEVMFRGRIKNKSELKSIMQMVGIVTQ